MGIGAKRELGMVVQLSWKALDAKAAVTSELELAGGEAASAVAHAPGARYMTAVSRGILDATRHTRCHAAYTMPRGIHDATRFHVAHTMPRGVTGCASCGAHDSWHEPATPCLRHMPRCAREKGRGRCCASCRRCGSFGPARNPDPRAAQRSRGDGRQLARRGVHSSACIARDGGGVGCARM